MQQHLVQIIARDATLQLHLNAQLHQHARSFLVRHEERVDR
jgi:hypothetical protein